MCKNEYRCGRRRFVARDTVSGPGANQHRPSKLLIVRMATASRNSEKSMATASHNSEISMVTEFHDESGKDVSRQSSDVITPLIHLIIVRLHSSIIK